MVNHYNFVTANMPYGKHKLGFGDLHSTIWEEVRESADGPNGPL